jgi:drug/metabolite transporter (DMT)-like permease
VGAGVPRARTGAQFHPAAARDRALSGLWGDRRAADRAALAIGGGAVRPAEWLSLLWLSLAGNTLYYVLLSMAIQQGGIATTSLVIGFLPVAVTIIGSRDTGAVPLRRLMPSLLLCGCGALCIGAQALGGVSAAGGARLTGLLCAIGALVSWTAYAVGNSRCLARLDHISAHDWSLLTGMVTGAQALLLIPVSLLLEPCATVPVNGGGWGRCRSGWR